MRSLKLKTICNVAAMEVHVCLQHPHAKLGEAGMVRTVEITEIPDDVETSQVLKAWRETADVSYLGSGTLKYPRHSYAFREIGSGKIILARKGEHI